MEGPALEAVPAADLQAAKAHLQSLRSWRYEDRPPPATAPDELLGGAVPRREAGHPGQPRQAHGRRGRGEIPHASAPARTCREPEAVPEGPAGPPRLDPQARQGGAAGARDTDAAGPGGTDACAARPRTRMGGSL